MLAASVGIVSVLAYLGSPPEALEQAPPEPPPAATETEQPPAWVVGGFVETQYILNSNFPDNHIFRGTAVSSRTGEFSPNLLVAYVRKDPVESPWMFELAFQAGAAVDALYYPEPVPGGETGRYAGAEAWKHIGRAWGGVRFESGAELAAGVMPAPIHLGSFWAKDNWHSSITWGFSSVPFMVAGVRGFVPFGSRGGVGLWLVNGYGTIGDGNKAPSGLVQFTFNPRPGWSLVQNVYAGPEDADLRPRAWRLLLDSQVAYSTERWGIAAVANYGRERLTLAPGEPVAMWANAMVSLRWHVLGDAHRWGMAVRPELFWDHGGRMFGSHTLDNWWIAGTFTNDLRLFDSLLFRVEYRYDRTLGEGGFFYRGPATADTDTNLAADQHSVIFNLVVYFERQLAAVTLPCAEFCQTSPSASR